jgi:two-component system response regulator YesN
MEFRTRVRIGRAIDLLKTTQSKLSAVAMDCGFNNLTAFHRLFKKTTGLTPAEMRVPVPPSRLAAATEKKNG